MYFILNLCFKKIHTKVSNINLKSKMDTFPHLFHSIWSKNNKYTNVDNSCIIYYGIVSTS